ncbi:CocE/NonD family hydrolase [Burkholderia contaminans]|uniref:CocE/NonD family hydrolase n=1 Tax=Burkholderia contaminans TaxID=488447 RepID=A0A3N8PUA1_9BURK|nr:CocE/NonD family hydrolase [Burkholderia contaminans]RQT14895.1 CocE/NonD family hydrolase [Burkholderia contaminans]
MKPALHMQIHAVREVAHFWIVLKDGTRLSARMWMPEDAGMRPVPAILEYLPYRKRDGTAFVDEQTHPRLASYGYACIRVDIRGTGESDGYLDDEYLAQEQDDAVEVIAWIRAQRWCTGRVGMMGVSWGGFNALQVAAREPEGLDAIVTVCSTVDRYADDVHFKGGNLLFENVAWGAAMMSFMSAPPDPLLAGSEWRQKWLDRLDNMPLMVRNWLNHQDRDDYWKHGSVCENYRAIKAAVYCVGGWGDAYRNSVGKMLANLGSPTKALIGPWIHGYPHLGTPAPAIDFVLEMKRWWDYWLKGVENGIMDEPMATFYMQQVLPPKPSYDERPGTWVRASTFPPADNRSLIFTLGANGSMNHGDDELAAELTIRSPVTVGTQQGKYCAVFGGPEGHADQRRDDAVSVCFDTAALSAPISLAGGVELRLRVSLDQPSAQLVAKLSAVAPNGAASLLTYGAARVDGSAQQDVSHETTALESIDVIVAMDDIGVTIPAGYKLRLALSTGSFPLLWPCRYPSSITLVPGRHSVHMPVFSGGDAALPFDGAPPLVEVAMESVRAASLTKTISEDVGSGSVTVDIHNDLGEHVFTDHGLRTDHCIHERYSAVDDDPLSVQANLFCINRVSRHDWAAEVSTSLSVSCDFNDFIIDASQVAKLGNEEVHRRTWHHRVSRTHV